MLCQVIAHHSATETLQEDRALQQATTTIRMGATAWSVTIDTASGPLVFDFRRMTKDERRDFHAKFMAAYRKINPYKPRASAKTR